MRDIARLPAADRRALFANTAEKTGLTDAIVEKDFWVCWMLDYLFHSSKWKANLAFKGGTSLSKAYGLIERFSEDIDLILDWRVLGYGKDEPWDFRSNTQRDKFIKEAQERTIKFLHDEFASSVQADISTELDADIKIKPDPTDNQTILFTYPKEYSDTFTVQDIRLEIGALAAWSPSAWSEIKPYAAEHYAHVFSEPTTSILTVLPERTFWEKATILHQEAHRPESKVVPNRHSRHYYDMFRLSESYVKKQAFMDLDLLERVVVFKDRFYHSSWAQYDKAKPGSMRLVPPDYNLNSLREDYEHMRGMIFGEKPEFVELIESIRVLENEINNLKR